MSDVKNRTYEKKVVHPATMRWLEDNGYTYKYEAPMPEYGKVDFRAISPDGTIVLVEGKGQVTGRSGRDIVQLLDYMRQVPGSQGAVAVPTEAVNDYLKGICETYHLLIIELDVPPRKAKEVWQHRFNLPSDNPDDVVLHEFLLSLADEGKAAQWIRDVLNKAIVSTHGGTSVQNVVPQKSEPETHVVLTKSVNGTDRPFNPVPKPSQTNKRSGTRYENIKDET
jgi:hypothetical protein